MPVSYPGDLGCDDRYPKVIIMYRARLPGLLELGLYAALVLSCAHCRGYFSPGSAESGTIGAAVNSTDANGAATPVAAAPVSGNTDANFDAGPLSPATFVFPPVRSGFVSPVRATSICLTSYAQVVTGVQCATQSPAQIAVAYERLVVSGKCLTTTRGEINLAELPVSVLPCNGADPNQRFGYKGGAFLWGQNPNRCLDASHLIAGDGPLVAKMCDGGGNQVFTMHSQLSDSQPALAMGPPSLFTPMGNGFLGSDAGATASLDYNRTIFLFNDTYGNQQGGDSRANINSFVHNTVGVMACGDISQTKDCSIKYYFGGQQDYTQAIFNDPNSAYYFWPTTGTLYDGSLYVINQRIVSSSQGLGFSAVGSMVGRISNPQDTPDLWDKQQYDVSHDPNFVLNFQIWQRQTPSGTWPAAADDGNYAYYYFSDVSNGLIRLPFDKLTDPNAYLLTGTPAWQYLNTQNVWTAWPDGSQKPADLATSAAPIEVLGNINYDAATKTYYFLGQSDNLFISTGTYYATAPSASGPWSEAKFLYQPPQYNSSSSNYIPNCSCYASESHPEMSPPGKIAFTYQCNASDTSNVLINRQNLVVMPIPW